MTDIAIRLGRLLQPDGLAHLVFYDRDTPKVVLDAGPTADDGSQDPSVPDRPRLHERMGRQLYYILEELQPDFAALRTGDLIRTVVRVPTGAVLFYMVEPGYHLYAATAAVDRLDQLDAQLAESVNDLRTVVRYSPLNYGSWFNKWLAMDAPPAAPAAETPRVLTDLPQDGTEGGTDPADYVFHKVTDQPDIPPQVSDRLLETLRVDGLHYVSYFTGTRPVFTADIFRHPALVNFFRGPTQDERREKYGRIGRLLPAVTRRMNLSLRAVLEGEIHQVVLDVEQGAVYFHALPDRRFLLGVTLDQSKVAEADRQIGRIGRELAAD